MSSHPFTIRPCCEHLTAINNVKVTLFGLPAENLHVNRDINYDNFLVKLDHIFQRSRISVRALFLQRSAIHQSFAAERWLRSALGV